MRLKALEAFNYTLYTAHDNAFTCACKIHRSTIDPSPVLPPFELCSGWCVDVADCRLLSLGSSSSLFLFLQFRCLPALSVCVFLVIRYCKQSWSPHD